jgi:hypothetical protein
MRKHERGTLSLQAALLLCGSAVSAQTPPPPRAGTYECTSFITTVQAVYEYQTNLVRGTQGLELELRPNGVQITRMPFDFVLDGRGGYTVTNTRDRGTYRYDQRSGQFSIAGDVKSMKPMRYFVKNGISGLVFDAGGGTVIQCENRGGGATGGRATGAASRPGTGREPAGVLNGGLRGRVVTTESNEGTMYLGKVFALDLTRGGYRVLFDDGIAAANANGTFFHVDRRLRTQITDSTGARLAMLNDTPVPDVRDLRPAISADGARIAVANWFKAGSLFDREVGEQVIVMDRTGRQLASFRGYTDPAFLPDGGLVVSGASVNDARRNEGLFVIDRDLRAVRRLAPGLETASMPAVSADGQRIAFVQRGEVWAVPVAGGPAVQILNGGDAIFPVWSPDGQHLAAAVRTAAGPTRSIIVVHIKADTSFYLTGGDGRPVKSNNRIIWLR